MSVCASYYCINNQGGVENIEVHRGGTTSVVTLVFCGVDSLIGNGCLRMIETTEVLIFESRPNYFRCDARFHLMD